MAERSAYTVLGLSKGASDAEIKKAYVQLVKKYDPEKHTDRFMVIQQAYNKLKDTKKRAGEDLQTYNPMPGDFLFLDDEKVGDEDSPSDEQIASAREEYNKSAGAEKDRDKLVGSLMRRSHYAFMRKNYNDCIKDWEEVQKVDPSNVRARANLTIAYGSLGLSYAHHELEDEAVDLWEKALKLNPDNTSLLQNLALACEKQGQNGKAQEYWGAVIKQWESELEERGDDEYLRECIIEAHRRQGGGLSGARSAEDKQSAIERLREVLKLRPDDFDARYQLANHYMDEGEYDQAREELEAVMRSHPRNIEAINLLGWALLNVGRFDEAFGAWTRVLSIDPKNVSARENIVRTRLSLGKQYREQGMFTQALVHLKTLQRYMPNSAEVLMEIAATFDMKGDVRSARTHYEKVLAIDPKNRTARKAMTDLRAR